MRIVSTDILATMKLKSVPEDTYFLIKDCEADYAYYKDNSGDIFELSVYDSDFRRVLKIPYADDDSMVFIVKEELVNLLKGSQTGYLEDAYDDFEQLSFDDPYEDIYNVTCEQLYEEGNY